MLLAGDQRSGVLCFDQVINSADMLTLYARSESRKDGRIVELLDVLSRDNAPLFTVDLAGPGDGIDNDVRLAVHQGRECEKIPNEILRIIFSVTSELPDAILTPKSICVEPEPNC